MTLVLVCCLGGDAAFSGAFDVAGRLDGGALTGLAGFAAGVFLRHSGVAVFLWGLGGMTGVFCLSPVFSSVICCFSPWLSW